MGSGANLYINSILLYGLRQVVSPPQQANQDLLEKLNTFRLTLKKIKAFLLVKKCDVTPAYQEKFPSFEKLVMDIINSHKQMRPEQGPPPVQSHENYLNPLAQSSNIQGLRMMQQKNPSFQKNPISSLFGASYAQVNMSDNLKPKPNVDAGQGSGLALVQQGVVGSLQQTNMNAFSAQNGANLVQPNISNLQSASSVNQRHVQEEEQQAMLIQQRRHQIQEPREQMLQKQRQQQQHQQSRHHQQTGKLLAHQVPQLQNMEKSNGVNIRQGFGASQHHGTAVRQPSVYHHRLKSGVSFSISSSQMLQTSPQNFQNSSREVDQQKLLVSVSKAGTLSESGNSSFIRPPPFTPLAPSHMQGVSETLVSNVLPLTTTGNIRVQQSAPYAATQVLAIETSGIPDSPLLAELVNQEMSHGNTSSAVTKSSITEEPIDRLIKAVS